MGIDSMSQDIIMRKKKQSEIETLNGYFLQLAAANNIKAPYNKVIYELGKKEFNLPEFEPLSIDNFWEKIQENI